MIHRPKAHPFIRFDFESIPATGWLTVMGILSFKLIYSIIVNLYIFPSDILRPIVVNTGGLIQATLIVNLIGLGLILTLLLRSGKLRKTDLGLKSKLIPPAVFVTTGIWSMIQIIGLATTFISTGSLALDSIWQNAGLTVIIGALIAQLAGNALVEEITYRGFLLPQIFSKLKDRWQTKNRKILIAVALVISQSIFAAFHIPNRIFHGLPVSDWPLDLFTLLGAGILFAFIYLRTGNLFIAIGLHAMANVPASLFFTQEIARYLVYGFGILLIIFYPQNKNPMGQSEKEKPPQQHQNNPDTG